MRSFGPRLGPFARAHTRSQTRALTLPEAEALMRAVVGCQVFSDCEPLAHVRILQLPVLPPLGAFAVEGCHDMYAGPRLIGPWLDLGAFVEPRRRSVRGAVPPALVNEAIALARRFAELGQFGGAHFGVALPGTPLFDPMEYSDSKVSLGHIRLVETPHVPGRFSRLDIEVDHRPGGQDGRLGQGLVDVYTPALRAAGLNIGPEPLAVGINGGGRMTLSAPKGSGTLYISRFPYSPTWSQFEPQRREALARGVRVVATTGGAIEDGLDFTRLTVWDPSAPFTARHVGDVLESWGGRVVTGSVGGILTVPDYADLRAEYVGANDPFGRWDVSISSAGVRDLPALAEIGGRLPKELGVGTVAGPDGEELDVFVSYQERTWRLVAYARSLDTDTAAVFGEVLGDATLIAPKRSKQ